MTDSPYRFTTEPSEKPLSPKVAALMQHVDRCQSDGFGVASHFGDTTVWCACGWPIVQPLPNPPSEQTGYPQASS